MTNAERKAELSAKVEELLDTDMHTFLTTKGTTQKQMNCTQCGRGFHGRAGATTCGTKCRQQKSRS